MQVRYRPVAATVTVLALAAVLTACFEDGPVTAPSGVRLPPTAMAAATTTPSSATRAPSSSAGPRTTSRTSGVRRSVAPGSTMLTDLRTGARDGYDRVVLEFSGPVPPYRVTREAGPITDCGSGAESGGAGEYLVLRAEPVGIFDHDGYSPYTGPRSVAGPGNAVVRAIISCAFEGQLQVAVRLTGNDQRFTDSTLTGPSRIVLDVRD